MTQFLSIPEALDYVAGQSWLAPDEPIRIAPPRRSGRSPARQAGLSWREAVRQIAGIVRRIERR